MMWPDDWIFWCKIAQQTLLSIGSNYNIFGRPCLAIKLRMATKGQAAEVMITQAKALLGNSLPLPKTFVVNFVITGQLWGKSQNIYSKWSKFCCVDLGKFRIFCEYQVKVWPENWTWPQQGQAGTKRMQNLELWRRKCRWPAFPIPLLQCININNNKAQITMQCNYKTYHNKVSLKYKDVN